MKRLLVCFLFSWNVFCVYGQREAAGDVGAWLLILNHYKFNDRWKVGNELHVRRNDWLKEQKQFLIRPYLNYHFGEGAILTIGYTYIRTSPFGATPLPLTVPENNIWEQLTLNHTYNKLIISHRYRIEHRFIGSPEQDNFGDYYIAGHRFENRLRYRITAKREIDQNWFIHFFNEVWIHQEGLKPSSLDRNWLYTGFGYQVNDGVNFQLAYMHQWVKTGGESYLKRPTIQMTFQYDMIKN